MSVMMAIARYGVALISTGVRTAAAESQGDGPLGMAWQAIQDYEAVLNARDANGYISLQEGPQSLANRLSRYIADDYVGVTGLGPATEVFGYQGTLHGPLELAGGTIGFQGLSAIADQLAGGNGTADAVHIPVDGGVSGNVGYFILNFAWMGSFVDADGNRLPVEIPYSLIDPSAQGSVKAVGRCICTCERIDGQWKITSFYFVLTPQDLLHAVP